MKYGFAIAASAVAAPALAQTVDQPALCTDRPTKSNAVCTVPAGVVQLESDLASWTRSDTDGMRADTLVPFNPTIKLGLGANTDLQLTFAPYVDVRTRAAGAVDHQRGVGDLTVRLKQRLPDPDSKLQFDIIPFVKIPTATRGIGNGEWEGGIAIPVQLSLPDSFTLTFGPESDLLADSDGSGRHVQLVGTVNIARPVSPTLTLAAELWTAQNFDPAGTTRQYSADVAAAWLLRPTLQLDAGANLGLNRVTPDVQLYLGISTRF